MRRARTLLAVAAVVSLLGACTSDDPTVTTPTAPVVSAPAAPTTPGRTPSPTAPRSLLSGPPRLEKVADADDPVHLSAPGDGRLYIVERAGRVIVVEDGKVREQLFLDISDRVQGGGEQGLLSIAFSPTYARDGLLYAFYTNRSEDQTIVELRRGSGERVDPDTERELLTIKDPYSNHNGGLLLFDRTGMLLIGLGDGGSGGDPDNRAQDLGDLWGKILRINPRPSGGRPYGVPADNPFVGRDGARAEIWAWGLRNPWRFAFTDDGTFYVADVGQNSLEEVSVVPADRASGANYGWSAFEGTESFKPERLVGKEHVKPAITYGRDDGCSITGGAVYTGSVAELRGHYLYGDHCSGKMWAARVDGAGLGRPQLLPFEAPSVSSFGVDAAGEMYVVLLDGPVYRITAG